MKKQDKNGGGCLVQGVLSTIGFVVGFAFIWMAFATFFRHKSKYNVGLEGVRVQDSSAFYIFSYPFISASFFVFVFSLLAINKYQGAHSGILFYISLPLVLFFAALAIAFAGRMGTMQLGVLIYKERDTFIIPTDVNNNTLIQNLLFKYLIDYCSMEELRLSDIMKITRDGTGKKFFVHGKFGTRCITWRDKQKREECIASLEYACGRRLTTDIAYG